MTDIIATLTDEMERRQRENWITGKSARVVSFVLGDAGVDPLNPSITLTPDTTLLALPSQVFGPKPISSVANANGVCPVFSCFLDYGDAIVPFSSIGLIAQIVYSPIPGDPELGSTFLWAYANIPRVYKSDLQQLTQRVGVQR